MNTADLEQLLLLLAMATTAGLLGCFVVMRRMVLAADALSHVALPGIGLALILGRAPLAGAAAALLLGTLAIWAIEGRSRLATETVIGVVFSAALAAGAMMTTGDELIESLLGRPRGLSPFETILALATALAVAAFLAVRRRELLISLVSRDLAVSLGIRLRRLELEFLLAFAATVALGLRYLGVLLMGSLVIIPAAAAKRVARNLGGMVLVSVGVALVATLLGSWIGTALGRETGPPIVLVAAVLFALSLARRPAV
jgi:ABC-type Mn2+/Zn2+ transport system permease subunit